MSTSKPDAPHIYIACVLPQDDLPHAHELSLELSIVELRAKN